MPAVVVTAVTGPSGVGKTTFVDRLRAALRPAVATEVVHADDFFTVRLADPNDYGPSRPNLETPAGIDWPTLRAAVAGAHRFG